MACGLQPGCVSSDALSVESLSVVYVCGCPSGLVGGQWPSNSGFTAQAAGAAEV